MNTLRRTCAAVALSVVLPLPLLAPAMAAPAAPPHPLVQQSEQRLALTKPTGPAAVGIDTLHLVDSDREDPWNPQRARELMVSLYYPAARGGGNPARYLSTREARLLVNGIGRQDQISARQVAETRTNAVAGARPVAGRHPLVVLSPGFTVHRATLSGLAEELASRGYVVAVLDHAYETFGTTFPGGRTLSCRACDEVEQTENGIARVPVVRAKDVSFLLDRLTGAHPVWRHANLIDRHRIGMAGHSIGGNSVAETMARDPRVLAGANLDGTFFAEVPRTGLNGRPFLMLGTNELHNPSGEDRSWPRDWKRLDGWKRWLTVRGSGHFSFTDLPVLAGQLDLPPDPGISLSGKRSGEITNGYLAAFFESHLRGKPQPLLDGPTPQNPEVIFHNPK